MIEIDISKKLFSAQGEFTLALQMNIGQGEFVSLFGQSGAGKTTIIDLILGLLRPQKGEILIDGINIDEIDKKSCSIIDPTCDSCQ